MKNSLFSRIRSLLIKYKEQILYIFFGGLTTLINMVVYFLCRQMKMNVVPADIVAWILAVIFAYVTNKIWVFESKSWAPAVLAKELVTFFGARLFSLGVDVAFLYVTVEKLQLWDLPMKLIANIIVIILNYIFSKLIVFSKQQRRES